MGCFFPNLLGRFARQVRPACINEGPTGGVLLANLLGHITCQANRWGASAKLVRKPFMRDQQVGRASY